MLKVIPPSALILLKIVAFIEDQQWRAKHTDVREIPRTRMSNFEQFSHAKLFYAAHYGGEENRAQQLPFHSSAGE